MNYKVFQEADKTIKDVKYLLALSNAFDLGLITAEETLKLINEYKTQRGGEDMNQEKPEGDWQDNLDYDDAEEVLNA